MVATATNLNITVPQNYTTKYSNTSHPTTISKKFIILKPVHESESPWVTCVSNSWETRADLNQQIRILRIQVSHGSGSDGSDSQVTRAIAISPLRRCPFNQFRVTPGPLLPAIAHSYPCTMLIMPMCSLPTSTLVPHHHPLVLNSYFCISPSFTQ